MKTTPSKFPVRNLTENLWLIVFLIIMLIVSAVGQLFSQSLDSDSVRWFDKTDRGRYKLSKTMFRLKDGSEIDSEWLGITRDSVVLADRRPPAGSIVSIKHKPTRIWVEGKVISVTDTTLIMEGVSASYQIYLWSQISSVQVNRLPEGMQQAPLYRFIGISRISWVNLNRVGSGSKGFLLGGLVGGVAGYAVGYSAHQKSKGTIDFGPAVTGAAGASLGVIIGGIAGLGIANAGNDFPIEGSRTNLDQVVKGLRKR